MTLTFWWALFKALPDLIAMLKSVSDALEQAEIDQKVKDNAKQIHEAFSEQDPAKLRALFNSK